MSSTEKVMKALAIIAVGLGLLLGVLLLLRKMYMRNVGLSVVPAPLADPNYGTETTSGIPWYDQYQSDNSPTEAVRAIQQDPTSLNLTYAGAIPPAPVNINAKEPNAIQSPCGKSNGCQGKVGCMDSSAANYDPTATCPGVNMCVAKLYGCLDKNNGNYNPWANTHDERFCTKIASIGGCKNPLAINYNPNASFDNGSCQPVKVGCMLSPIDVINHDAAANVNDLNACIPAVRGCTNMNAPNYQIGANVDDGTCLMTKQVVLPAAQQEIPTCPAFASAPLNSGCLPTFQDPLLGGFRNCGDPWDLRSGLTNTNAIY